MCHDYLFLEKYIFGTFPKKSLTQVWLVRLFTLFSACESQGEQSSFARNQTRCIVLSRGIKEEVSSSRKWNDAWWCNTGPTTSLYGKYPTSSHSFLFRNERMMSEWGKGSFLPRKEGNGAGWEGFHSSHSDTIPSFRAHSCKKKSFRRRSCNLT